MIRILIAEDQQMVLGALAALLALENDFQIVGQAQNGRQALELCLEHQPDIVLTDIEMPEMSGLDLSRHIKETQLKTRVVILTTFARPGYLRRALEHGASGYLLKASPSDQLARAIRRVAAGGRAVDPELALEAWTEDDPLTERERQVLKLAGEGLSSAQISEELHLAEGTVRNYLSEAIAKVGAHNRIEAARIAHQKGWL